MLLKFLRAARIYPLNFLRGFLLKFSAPSRMLFNSLYSRELISSFSLTVKASSSISLSSRILK